MNHWELVLLDIWWVIRWFVPAAAAIVLWEFLKWDFKRELEPGDSPTMAMLMIVTHGLIYWIALDWMRQ